MPADEEVKAAADDDFVDPEAAEEPEAKPSHFPAEDDYSLSLFSNGFETFEALQRNIVADIVSDDEDAKPARRGPNQGGRETGRAGRDPDQKLFYDQIQSGIEMLLDSDDDDPGCQAQDDGTCIEKDMDNWF